MEFDELRFADKQIEYFKKQRAVAAAHGGDVEYFDRLIRQWIAYRMILDADN